VAPSTVLRVVFHAQESLATWPIFVFLGSGTACLFFSSVFHLFFVVSETWHIVLVSLDYTGIALLISGSMVPVVYYGFYCNEAWQRLHLIGICVLCVASITVTLLPKFR
jgi:adiponectin receptor